MNISVVFVPSMPVVLNFTVFLGLLARPCLVGREMASEKLFCLLVSLFILSFPSSSYSKPLHEANSFVSWLKRLEDGLRNKILSNGACEACKVLTFLAQAAFVTKDSENDVVYESRLVCEKLKIEDNRVCTEVISEFKNEVLTVVDKVLLSPTEVCGSLLGPSCAHIWHPSGSWNVTIPEKKPPIKPIPPPKVCIQKMLLKISFLSFAGVL